MNKLDPNAATFLSTAGITDQATVQAINNLVKSLKTTSLWTRCIAIWPFVGGTAVTNKYNLVNPAQYNLTFGGTWVHATTGSLPNGSTAYADTNVLATTLSQSNAHLAFYSRTNNSSAGGICIGAATNTSPIQSPLVALQIKGQNPSANTGLYYNATGATAESAVYTNTDGRGFYVGSKTSNAIGGVVLYKNGVSQAANTVVPTVAAYPTAKNLILSAWTSGATPFYPDNKECAYASVGLSMTATQVATYNTIITNFQTALSRNV